MTGSELIEKIKEYDLLDAEILTQKWYTPEGDYIEFSIPNPKPKEIGISKILWVTDNKNIRGMICNQEGELTYRSREYMTDDGRN